MFDALGTQFRLIAPDYPGFGYSDAPPSAADGGTFAYTFDRLSHIIELFCAQLGLSRFVLFAFDFGAPVGFRIACRHPEWIAGVIVQNANAYDEGLSTIALYGPGAAGAEGVARVVAILRQEFDMALALTGRPSLAAVDRSVLR